jgi:hypothetical protein
VLVFAGVPEAVSEEVDGAALPGAREDLGDRRLQAAVGVADRQLDADQTALDQPSEEGRPEASVSASPTSIERISRRPVSWTPRSARRATARRASTRRAKARERKDDVEARILESVNKQPQRTTGDIAKELNLDRGTIAAGLSRLVRASKITRHHAAK